MRLMLHLKSYRYIARGMITHLANRLNSLTPDNLAPASPHVVTTDPRRNRRADDKAQKPLWVLKLVRRANRFKSSRFTSGA
ncbi:MAG: hypothetical protein B7Z26_04235 [Asticcacaulis sp. 32-58-5]|nr:MAG: hypothetical protein B7Z26_04235 [Asticcacaulis sp. 32-58-5]